MSKSKNTFILVAVVVLLVSLACNLGATMATPQQSDSQPPANAPGQPQPPASAPTKPQPTVIKPTSTPSGPIPLRQGLSSLNSYTYQMKINVDGPTSNDKNDTLTQVSYNSKNDSTKVYLETVSSTAAEPKESHSATTRYQIGDQVCSVAEGSDAKPTLENTTSAQSEMTDIVMHLTDTTISVDNPVLAGVETVNNIKTNHFTFKVTGLGKKSGAEVTQSSGEYWVALDGRYLVKYSVILETRTAPAGNAEAQVMHTEVYYELSDVNADVSIVMPAGCK